MKTGFNSTRRNAKNYELHSPLKNNSDFAPILVKVSSTSYRTIRCRRSNIFAFKFVCRTVRARKRPVSGVRNVSKKTLVFRDSFLGISRLSRLLTGVDRYQTKKRLQEVQFCNPSMYHLKFDCHAIYVNSCIERCESKNVLVIF